LQVGHESMPTLSFWKANRFRYGGLVAIAAVACLLLVAACPVDSQDPSSAPVHPGAPSATSESPPLLISVRAKDGAPVELSAADLEIKIDGNSARVNEVRRLGRVLLHYCILFDASGGRRKFIELQREEAREILSKIIQTGSDRGMAVAFSDKVYLDGERDDPAKLAHAFDDEIARGSTSLYNAVVSVADDLAKDEPEPRLRVIFLLSDGDDNSRFYSKVEEKDVSRIVADIAGELNSLFSVTYTPPIQNRDGRLHKLELKCRKKGISISAPDRYYAPR
jgi:hypothetical protein